MRKLFFILGLIISLSASAQTWSVIKARNYTGSNSLGYLLVAWDSVGYARVSHLSIADIVAMVSTSGGGPTLTYASGRYYNAYGNFVPFLWDSLGNKPTIPTQTSQLTNNSGFLTAIDTLNIAQFYLKVRAGLSTVAVTGSYLSLSNLPTFDSSSIPSFFLKVRAGLSPVAWTGNYNDLSNRPTIPTNNNTLTNGAGYYAPADTVSTLDTKPNHNKYSDSAKAVFTPMSRTFTINGVAQDFTTNRTWSVGTLTAADSSWLSTLAMLHKFSDSAKTVYNYSINNLSIGGFNFSLGAQGTQRTWSIGTSLPGIPTGTFLTAASAGINTTETKIVSYTVAANQMTAGSKFEVDGWATCTSTVANLSTLTVRFGPLGTTGDNTASVLTATGATSGTGVPFHFTFVIEVRTNGSAGTMAGFGELKNSGVTGVSTTDLVISAPTLGTAINTTVSNIIAFWYKSAATTTTTTFQILDINVKKI